MPSQSSPCVLGRLRALGAQAARASRRGIGCRAGRRAVVVAQRIRSSPSRPRTPRTRSARPPDARRRARRATSPRAVRTVPRAQRGRVGGAHEVPTDSKRLVPCRELARQRRGTPAARRRPASVSEGCPTIPAADQQEDMGIGQRGRQGRVHHRSGPRTGRLHAVRPGRGGRRRHRRRRGARPSTRCPCKSKPRGGPRRDGPPGAGRRPAGRGGAGRADVRDLGRMPGRRAQRERGTKLAASTS